MEVIWDIDSSIFKESSVVTIGTFDGIHLGHQAILRQITDAAQTSAFKSTLITFEPHPQLVLHRKDRLPVQLLTTIDEKIEILGSLDLNRLVILEFTREFAALSPERFVKEVLVDKLAMKKVITGHDHAFGKDRTGNFTLLQNLGRKHNFTVQQLAPIQKNGMIISSTKIRKLLLNGRIEDANKLLGRRYSVQGQVVPGHGRGRELGFPTANIVARAERKLIPMAGIYATKLKTKSQIYDSVTYIGSRATFNLVDKVIEVHAFDFYGELYGETVELDFISFVRNDAKYNSTAELISQIEIDAKQSKELLRKSS